MGGITKLAGGLFSGIMGGGSKPPPVAPAPPAPTGRDPAVLAAEEEERRKRSGAGRASTIIAGDALGQTGGAAPGARKVLTGQ